HSSAQLAWLLAAKRAVENRGVNAEALMRQVGMDLSAITDPMARYPAHLGLSFWQLALQTTQEELLGLDVAFQFVPLNFNALGYALMASENLADMYVRLGRYVHVVTDAGAITFTPEPGAGRLSISGDPGLLGTVDPSTRWSIFDYAMLSIVRGSRMLFGRDFTPLEVRLQRQKPRDHVKFEKVFRCTPLYGCEDNALLVDHTTLHKPLSYANLEVVKASEEAMDRYGSSWQTQALLSQLTNVFKELLPSGEPLQQEVAQRLSMTLRGLQRRLAEQQTCYREVLNQTRHTLALDYLGSKDYAIGDVAFLLGFSEVSGFTRAFKRWTGSSPRSWRNQTGLP
ncbi:MAG: AraC family transcriptional regulator, partial [Pseudomonadota bacterium]